MISLLRHKSYYDQVHKDHCEKLLLLHKDKAQIPTGGGWLFLILFLLFATCCLPLNRASTWLFIFLFLSWSSLGWYDDSIKNRAKTGHGISARTKLFAQLVIAIITVVSIYYIYGPEVFYHLKIPFLGEVCLKGLVLGKVICFSLAILAIVGTCNSVNLTDGLDGLASGTVAMAGLGCLVIGLLKGNTLIACDVLLILSVLIGSCLAFLWYNASPAQIFMGDTGSLLLGGVLGSCAVMLRAELILPIFGMVFVAEAGSVILQVLSCKFRHKRVFLCAPLHHHYEYQGIPETKIVVRFWIAASIFTTLGIISSLLG
ncbi:phospho-N-acetylmuramoyl-pentapeptide-transferase [Chlamydia ibidis]|uniref:Phospho-N-acetylmuramoyl-pentapeptide-transferase n=2 Tax=Chlamydia ibidis TaxID=1405396 RepID=S7J441_9CHLA|nr:phospho-N-acetylmuramoyl-pentapeptide-transferase [Chlamydia ibidis]EQM62360.1 phospho-N-acetylmuramoyl-pentapeptide-transferase [Chlamydia ibidis 10-1398/6]